MSRTIIHQEMKLDYLYIQVKGGPLVTTAVCGAALAKCKYCDPSSIYCIEQINLVL